MRENGRRLPASISLKSHPTSFTVSGSVSIIVPPFIITCLMSVGPGRIRANLVGTNWLDESEPGHSVTARVVGELSSILAGGEAIDVDSEAYCWRRSGFFSRMRASLGLACAQATTLSSRVFGKGPPRSRAGRPSV